MSYFVTLYINPMSIINFNSGEFINIPHVFLGLSHKHPNELDKLDKQKNKEVLKSKQWDKIDSKWYEQIYPSILDSDFKNEGFFGFGPVNHASSHWGKVYENNQYIQEWGDILVGYYNKDRDKNTFTESNRCTLEVSKEQYEMLLEFIKQDVNLTKDRNGTWTKNDMSFYGKRKDLEYQLYYNSAPIAKTKISFVIPPIHNCVTWVLNKLDSIGIEVVDINEWIPDILPNLSINYQITKFIYKKAFDIEINLVNTLKDSIKSLEYYNQVFIKFQQIDSNLESIQAAKAFRKWAREMIGNKFICNIATKKENSQYEIICTSENEGLKSYLQNKLENLKHKRQNLYSIYNNLYSILSMQIVDNAKNKGCVEIKGDFIFILYNKDKNNIQILKKENNYIPYNQSQLDPNIPEYNWALNKNSPFVFVSKDKCMYANYTYKNISQSYIDSINKSYIAILSGKDDLNYWSNSLHKLRKSINKEALNG
ncbi:hypothetical protein [Helicobacter saguini]|uniref:hypothetical protein n=1 Tax=Helicobacter saguini TaxID=1548018 RepID=UPI000512B1B0|nr:hypothetical protein [Helicobacter saguini]